MKQFLLAVSFILLHLSSFGQGQCLGGGCAAAGTQWPGTTQSTSSTTFSTISTCMYAGDYALCNVTAGNTYEWSMCSADGVPAPGFNAKLTLYNNTVLGTPICFSEDFCLNQPKIQWTATFTGVARVKLNRGGAGACNNNTTCATVVWRQTNAATYNPCASITSLSCGVPVTANMSGSGAGWNITACGWTTNGQELIYSFTPTVSGTYSIQVNSVTGGFVDYFWKAAGTCNNTGWTCISDVGFTGSFGAMAWTAGTTYYILVDNESTTAASQNFQVVCPSGGGGPVTASDCGNSSNACTNLTFSVDPNGYGLVDELCYGCVSNPSTNPASTNSGCLLSGELNSTWLVVNVASNGVLNFSFGVPNSTNFNCYDWAMWPYTATTCASILANTLAPVRCNWNSPCEEFTGIGSTPPVGGSSTNFEPDLAVTAGQQYIICFSNYSSAVTTVPLNFSGTASVSCTPLPVDMLSFTGKNQGSVNFLEWATATELNNAFFTVERSVDGIRFTEIGKVQGHGYSPVTNYYNFHDREAPHGTAYYRLKQTDLNGVSSYSDLIAIAAQSRGLSVFPNPVSEAITIRVDGSWKGRVEVSIQSVFGVQVMHREVAIEPGQDLRFFDLEGMAAGTYIVTLLHPETNRVEKTKVIKH